MAVTVVVVPDIGDSQDVPVIEILVSLGESVEAEQPLVTLESDKATMDVPAPWAGVVGSIAVAVGDVVSQGTTLLELEAADGGTASGTDSKPSSAVSAATLHTPGSHLADVISDRSAGRPVRPPASTARNPAPGSCAPAETSVPPPSAPTIPAHQHGQVSHATPGVRRFARTLGVDLAGVAGSGGKGRILRTDVERHVKARLAQLETVLAIPGGGTGIPPIPPVDFSKFGPVETQALSRIKRISGPFLQRAWLNVPHVTYHDEADITELESFRKGLADDPVSDGARMTPLPFFMKALCAALREFPVFNSSLSPDGQSLILKQYFHIGIAVDTPNGLVVPVVRDVDRKGLVAIAAELAELSVRAREGKLKAEEMQGGCMSISSLGGIGGTAFTPLVNAPEVAILGIARSRMTPVWNGAEFVPRLVLPLSLSFDHRVVDGAEAAHFMSFLCARLTDLRRLLL